MLLGESVWCYVCITGERYDGIGCESGTLNNTYVKDCDVEGRRENKSYTMCRKFTQDGKSVLYHSRQNSSQVIHLSPGIVNTAGKPLFLMARVSFRLLVILWNKKLSCHREAARCFSH